MSLLQPLTAFVQQRPFASKYYGDAGLYLEDYAENFGNQMYVAPEAEHDFARFSAMLDARLASGVLENLKKP